MSTMHMTASCSEFLVSFEVSGHIYLRGVNNTVPRPSMHVGGKPGAGENDDIAVIVIWTWHESDLTWANFLLFRQLNAFDSNSSTKL